MAYLIRQTNEQGDYQIIDSDFQPLYEELENYQWQPLSDEQWQAILGYEKVTYIDGVIKGIEPAPSEYHELINGEWVLSQEKVQAGFKRNQQALIIKLKDKADELGNQLLHEYPQIEQTSFSIQKEEAIAWQKDNSTPTPVLTGIATARNLELSELVARVMKKTTAFETVTGMIAGQRQAIMDKLEQATEQTQLDEISKDIEQWQLSI